MVSGTVIRCENCTENARKASEAIEAQNRRIVELETALRKIAPSQRGLDMNADAEEQADYWSRLCFFYRNIATVALNDSSSNRKEPKP